MISNVKHMKIQQECKCLNVNRDQETTGFFPVVSMCWHTPLIHVVTLTKSIVTSQVTETWALTKSLRSPTRRGGAQATYNFFSGLPQSLASSARNTSITKIVQVLPNTKSNKFLSLHLTYTQLALTQAHLLHLQRRSSSRLKHKLSTRSSLFCSKLFLFFSRVASGFQGVKRQLK